ncbi:MAG: aminodeoxychorismate lyase [Lachnospiraceae bacterium]
MNSSKIVLNIVKICARLLVCVVIFAGVVLIGRGSYDFGYRIFTEGAVSDTAHAQTISVQITEGMGDMDIAKLLQGKGLCNSSFLFFAQMKLSDYEAEIRPGLYQLSTDMTPDEIIMTLGGGSVEAQEE